MTIFKKTKTKNKNEEIMPFCADCVYGLSKHPAEKREREREQEIADEEAKEKRSCLSLTEVEK